MRCEACHGEGKKKPAESETQRGPDLPCPECNGTGIAHCCDGMCAQPGDEQPRR